MRKQLRRLSRGQGAVEYGLLLGLIAVVGILAVQLFGLSVFELFSRVNLVLGEGATSDDGSRVLFSSDFDGGLDDWESVNWNRRSSDLWFTEAGRLVADRYSGIFLPDNTFDDFSYRVEDVDLSITSNSWHGASVFFRADNSSRIDGYSFRVQRPNRNDPGRIYFSTWANGYQVNPYIARVEAPEDFDWEGTYDLEVVARGTTLQGYINGELVLEAEDDTYSSGSVGLYSHSGSSLTADRIEVSSLP
jgi:Flp pilus assembly pilin Flp